MILWNPATTPKTKTLPPPYVAGAPRCMSPGSAMVRTKAMDAFGHLPLANTGQMSPSLIPTAPLPARNAAIITPSRSLPLSDQRRGRFIPKRKGRLSARLSLEHRSEPFRSPCPPTWRGWVTLGNSNSIVVMVLWMKTLTKASPQSKKPRPIVRPSGFSSADAAHAARTDVPATAARPRKADSPPKAKPSRSGFPQPNPMADKPKALSIFFPRPSPTRDVPVFLPTCQPDSRSFVMKMTSSPQ